MKMKLNYKEIFFIHLFVDAVLLALFLRHDSYHIFIAFASLMFSYKAACLITRSKIWMLILFVLISVTVCQVSVTGKKFLIDQDFNQELNQNPTGVLVADVVHGFKRIGDLRNIPSEIREKSLYGFFESTNYRYLTMGLFFPFMGISLVMRKPDRENQENNKKRLRRP